MTSLGGIFLSGRWGKSKLPLEEWVNLFPADMTDKGAKPIAGKVSSFVRWLGLSLPLRASVFESGIQ